MKLRQVLKDYFSFSRGERIGLAVLIILIVLVMLANHFIFYFEKPRAADRETFNRLLAGFDAPEELGEQLSLFEFDPNTVDSVTFFRLDLPYRVKRNWMNYRRRGGVIREKKDFHRIYGVTDSIYDVVEPFLLVTSIKKKAPNAKADKSVSTIKKETQEFEVTTRKTVQPKISRSPELQIELNKASASDFESLPGIGQVLSNRIVKYRDLLGGFVSIEQLKEVYGVKPEIVDSIRSLLSVDNRNVRKIDFNFLTVEELAKHPYINYKEARKIVDFRSKNGYISNKDRLLADSVLEEDRYQKVVPYLK